MYPWELAEFLKERGYYIGGDDLMKATSLSENPQLDHIIYEPFTNKYKMWDKEGHYYEFTAMPYEEAKQKGLVKKRERNRR